MVFRILSVFPCFLFQKRKDKGCCFPFSLPYPFLFSFSLSVLCLCVVGSCGREFVGGFREPVEGSCVVLGGNPQGFPVGVGSLWVGLEG